MDFSYVLCLWFKINVVREFNFATYGCVITLAAHVAQIEITISPERRTVRNVRFKGSNEVCSDEDEGKDKVPVLFN
jgi:hypothetical protein